MKRFKVVIMLLLAGAAVTAGCTKKESGDTSTNGERKYFLEKVRNVMVVQVYADGFKDLTLKEKMLAWHLYRSGIAGRDIYYDQNHKHALQIRNILEAIVENPEGIDEKVYSGILEYTKLFWINNCQYDADKSRKFIPNVSYINFSKAASIAETNGADFGLEEGEDLDEVLSYLRPYIFDRDFEPIKTNKNPEEGKDMLAESAVNFYDGVTLADFEGFEEKNSLNSKVVVENGELRELVYRAGGDGIEPGMYAEELEASARELEEAAEYAEPDQANVLRLLAKYFRTGDLEDFRTYNIAWVQNGTKIDIINGFIEVYNDPRGQKGYYEAMLELVDEENTSMLRAFAENALYFEQKAPWADEYKRAVISAPIANVVYALLGAGAAGPKSPRGINLPNEQAIREEYGSKSVVLGNVVIARHVASATAKMEEFAVSDEMRARAKKFGGLIFDLEVAMHEVVGHASGKKAADLEGDPADYIKEYYSTLEEARAELVALWNFFDPKLVEMGVAPSTEVGKAGYDAYAMGALTNLRKVPEGDQFEEDHDRATHLIVEYVRRNTSGIELKKIDGKTYFEVVDYDEMHRGIGEILSKLMEIKATGDYEGAKAIISEYGIKIDTELRDEILERSLAIGISDFDVVVYPRLTPLYGAEGSIIDIDISYPMDLKTQMLDFKHFFDEEEKDEEVDTQEVVIK
ncbi:peptidase M49 [Candidatus Marinimicrobia bacterium MT.SAG.2]|nr:peptidase M49 [Candidatus Marinimicrobia bacterium MT.SAG.2]